MPISLENKETVCHKFNYLNAVFTQTPSSDLLNQFVSALNENGHLPYTVSYEQLEQVPYIQIAQTQEGEFIAGCSIKQYDGELAEIGFMLVDKKYRRMGVAESMVEARINYAQQLGVKILYARVRGNNIASMNNLLNAGFRPVGKFLGEKDSSCSITWLCLSLQSLSYQECSRRLKKKLTNLIPVIGNDNV